MAKFEVWGHYAVTKDDEEFVSISLYDADTASEAVRWAKEYSTGNSGGYDSIVVNETSSDDEIIWMKIINPT